MKISKLFLTFLGVSFPAFALSNGFIDSKLIENDFEKGKYFKAELFSDRYNSKEILSEEKINEIYDLNFKYMGLGGNDPASSKVWNNYRGETIDNKPVKVAVIDSGIDIYHEEFLKPSAKGILLNESNVLNYSILDPDSAHIYIDYSTNKLVTDKGILSAYDASGFTEKRNYSHGTASSACIAAAINGVGGIGIAPNASLLILRTDLSFWSLESCIRYAVDHGASIINMSLGAYAEDFVDKQGVTHEGASIAKTYLQKAIDYAYSKDCIIVASAGNDSTQHVSYPAGNAHVVGVGALKKNSGYECASYSNRNAPADTKNGNHNVDVMAPGTVLTANLDNPGQPRLSNESEKNSDNTYIETQGTSFSSPLTAGAIALYRGKYPNKSVDEIYEALTNSCDDIDYEGWDPLTGFGRVNVERFLDDDVALTSATINNGEPIQLNATTNNPYPKKELRIDFLPLNVSHSHTKGVWTSSDDTVCSVINDLGLVYATGNGSATLTFISNIDNIKTSIKVNVSGMKPATTEDPKFNLDYDFVRLKKGQTFTIRPIANGTIYYYNSNKSIIDVSQDGVVTPKNIGLSYVKINCSNGLNKTIKIYVAPNYDLVDIKIDTSSIDLNHIPFASKFDYSKIKVTAIYNNGRPNKEIDYRISAYFDTMYIGPQTIKVGYQEYGITIKKDLTIFVTSEGAAPKIDNYEAFTSTSRTANDNYWESEGTYITGEYGEHYTLKITKSCPENPYFSYDSVKDVAVIGQNANNTPKGISLNCDDINFLYISKISIILSSKDADLSISVGGNKFNVKNQSSVKVGETMTEYSFIGNGIGNVLINIDNISAPVCIKSITIHIEEQSISSYSPSDQALSYIFYLQSISSCASNWTDREAIITLIHEYNILPQEVKDDLYFKEIFEDAGGYTTNSIEKLKMIVSQYNNSLNKGEKILTLVEKDAVNGQQEVIYTGLDKPIYFISNSIVIVGICISILMILSCTGLIIYKRKR